MIVISVILLFAVIVVFVRYIRLKRQLKSFTKQLREIRNEDQNRLISVDSFDKDYVNLANELNLYVHKEQTIIKNVENDRQHMKMLVAGISHDFRTPLTSATGYMQMVRRAEHISGKDAEYLDIAIDKTKHLKELSDEFFALSLLDVRREEDMETLSFKAVLENVTLGQYDWINQRGLDFSADIADESCMVKAVEVDLVRLLENLYSNARKYAVSRLHVALKVTESGLWLCMENDTDGAMGTDIDNIFEPFEHKGEWGTAGSGLGLYVAKRIVEHYGGDIKAVFKEDSVFRMELVLGTVF